MTPSPARRAPRRALLLAAVALAVSLAACDGGATADEAVSGDLASQFEARAGFTPLAEALRLTGVAPELAGGPFTVFAPTEAALRYVGTDFRPVLFADEQRQTLARILRHHIVPGRLGPDALTDGATLTALDGATLTVRRIGPVVTINGVTADVSRPLEADNGIAYPLADVLLDGVEADERVRLSPSLSILARGLRATPVAEVTALPRVTVLAPINDAFTALGQGSLNLLQEGVNRDVFERLLRTLVLPGDVDLRTRVGQTVTTVAGDVLPVTQDADGVLSVDGVRVLHAETTADGRFYVLAAPLFRGLTVSQRLRVKAELAQFLTDTPLVPGLPALLADLSAQVTVFAPADVLYNGRSPNTRATLRAPAQATLLRRSTGVHVVRGRYAPEDLTDGLQLTALDGTVLTVRRSLDAISIDDTPIRNPARLINGYLYDADLFVQPDVDLLDTVLLDGFADYFKVVRSTGIEAEFRSRAHTAWVVPDAVIGPFTGRPDAQIRTILRRTATESFLPRFEDPPTTFEALNGTERTVYSTGCPPAAPCLPFTFEPYYILVGETRVDQKRPKFGLGRQTKDRTGVWHRLEEPEFRLSLADEGAPVPP